MRGSTSSLRETPFTLRLIAFFMNCLLEQLDGCFMNLPLQTMNGPSDGFKLRVIVRFDRRGSLRFQLANARFDRALVDTDDVVMRVLNAECFGERDNEVFLI